MSQRLFIVPAVLLTVVVPASAQRVMTRVPAGNAGMPVVAPSGLNALLPAPGLALSAPSLAPGLAVPAPALPPAPASAVHPEIAASALARPARAAASIQAPGSEDGPKAASPLDALDGAARGENGGEPGSGRVFDGSDPMLRPLVEGWRVEGKD